MDATVIATIVASAALFSSSILLLLLPFAPMAAGYVTDMVATKPVLTSDGDGDDNIAGFKPAVTGGRIIMSTDVKSLLNETSTFAVIMEVKDSDGVTQFLDWRLGLIRPEAPADIGFGWTPQHAGTYEVCTFILSGTVNPEVYSPVVSSYFTVAK